MAAIISFMKYFSTVIAELSMVWVITQPDLVTDVVKDFICLGFIIELDDLFATSGINQEDLDALIEDQEPL